MDHKIKRAFDKLSRFLIEPDSGVRPNELEDIIKNNCVLTVDYACAVEDLIGQGAYNLVHENSKTFLSVFQPKTENKNSPKEEKKIKLFPNLKSFNDKSYSNALGFDLLHYRIKTGKNNVVALGSSVVIHGEIFYPFIDEDNNLTLINLGDIRHIPLLTIRSYFFKYINKE